jgi:K+-transporting ATPase ATPase C chain
MRSVIRPALVLLLVFTVLTGLVYPLVLTGVAKLVFPRQAEGSLIVRDGHAIGSRLIGQPFSDPRYFWGRLSATTPTPYNAASSTGSNLGPLNPALKDAVQGRIDALRAADPANTAPIPVDLVTASGSGLDPHVSLAAAEYQVARVARARAIDPVTVRRVVSEQTTPRTFGLLGEPTVNVLGVNLALDDPRSAPGTAPQ